MVSESFPSVASSWADLDYDGDLDLTVRHIAAAYAEVLDRESIERAEERFLEWKQELDRFETDLGGFVDAYVGIRERGVDPETLERVARFWSDALPDLCDARTMEVVVLRSLGLDEARERAERRLVEDLDGLEGVTEMDRRRLRREVAYREHHGES